MKRSEGEKWESEEERGGGKGEEERGVRRGQERE